MLTALNNNHESIQELRDTGYGQADFEVKKSTVEFSIPEAPFNQVFPSKEVYYRTDTLEPIAVHGRRYKPLQYREMIDKTRDMIERCNLDATGIKESIQVSPNGGMCLVDYTLPAKEYLTPDGDKGCVKVMALSSFNGVWSFILSLGFHQGACLNSQIFIKNPASIYKSRHTSTLDIDKGVYVLGKTANVIEDEIELWHEWYNTPVDQVERTVIFSKCANFKGDFDELLQDMKNYNQLDHATNKTLTYLNEVYNTNYGRRMGHNRWSVYNAITDWSTHAPSSSKNTIALSQRRTERASEVINEYLLAA